MATTNVTSQVEGPVAANNIMEESIMLVLSRKVGESILISESIRVTVVHAANVRIRLGIDAPPEVKVLREGLSRVCSNSSPSKNGKAEPLPSFAQMARAYRCNRIRPCETLRPPCRGTAPERARLAFAPFSQEGGGAG